MKLLIIAPFVCNKQLYPPLRCFIDVVGKEFEIQYCHIRGRAKYSANPEAKGSPLCSFFNFFIKAVVLVSDICRLFLHRWFRFYDLVIAIDEFGLVCAMFLFPHDKIIFWSMDIVTSDNEVSNNFLNNFLISQTARFISRSGRIIIQDPDRLGALEDAIGKKVDNRNKLYLPLFLHPVPGVVSQTAIPVLPVILQIGSIVHTRYSRDILLHYQSHYDKYRLTFHGHVSKALMEEIQEIEYRPIITNESLPSNHVYKIVRHCDVGFIGYSVKDTNYRLIKYASGQLLEFLRMGKPIIVMGETNLSAFVKEKKVGIGIRSMDEFNKALGQIIFEYTIYSTNAIQIFSDIFSSDLYEKTIFSWLMYMKRSNSSSSILKGK